MKETKITVTEAARNFADCINRAHYQNTSFVLLKNGRPVARIEPAREKSCTGKDLADSLVGANLSIEEVQAWNNELQNARETLAKQTDKWQ